MRVSFQFKPFSKKQKRVLYWWSKSSAVKDKDGIIADGAIRSGKTLSMSLSFVMWAMDTFDGENFIMAGKTIRSFERNVMTQLRLMLKSRGYTVEYIRADNMMTVRRIDAENFFYIFGGKDERSQDLVQGITAAGAFFDEVALMPENFVNQATGRCSVTGSKFWFNCNPESPAHWFKTGWIDKRDKKNLLYLHFTMEDNLSLTEQVKKRYRALYVGVFFQRYIEGLWAVAEGLIYPMFTDANMYDDATRPVALYSVSRRTIAVDYGTTNPCVFLDIWDDEDTIFVDNEYRWDSRSDEARNTGMPNKTDAQYADDMRAFMGEEPERQCMTVVDPSAKSFITELRNRGFYTKEGDNEVLDGIRKTASLLAQRKLMIHRRCKGLITELRTYAWNEKSALAGKEEPIKQADHAPDALRYYVKTCVSSWRTGF